MVKQDHYPLPLPDELIEWLRGAKIFSKLDLKWGYNLVRIREGDEWKTSFKCKFGQFKYLIMPFGLTNAPAAFQCFMNEILQDLLGICVVVYLDDILIFSKTQEEHEEQVREVLRRHIKNNLYCNTEKCTFHVEQIDYLGLIVSGDKVETDPEKVSKAVDWPIPKTVKQVQEFLGFVNFYQRFVPNYSKKARPLFELLLKDKKWEWGMTQQGAFEGLKQSLMEAPTLIQPKPNEKFYLECNASDFATGAILSQKDMEGKLHPVAFYSKSFLPAEQNYDIFNKEMLALICALKEWRHLLEGTETPVEVLTDHCNLEHFTVKKVLNRWQIRWANFLVDYNIQIKYCPGTQNKKADILSRRADFELPKGGGEPSSILDPGFFIAEISTDSSLDDMI
ncbi:Retrotransposable element Tf2 [Ceratobasidium theobromae]|uniref:Retrotransposable element Tf2 n=1 Tax=Ceratobasidium theobromae TaxID=1582974 RepID=A0A5N5Q810_9AGAM|nr:Retrotransposable element Tf2 [Ceratobasidium theobromae]